MMLLVAIYMLVVIFEPDQHASISFNQVWECNYFSVNQMRRDIFRLTDTTSFTKHGHTFRVGENYSLHVAVAPTVVLCSGH